MKNWFSLKLYLEGLKKVKTAGIAAAISVIALNAIIPIIAIIESNMSWPGQIRTVTTVPVSGFAPFNLMMMLFGIVLAHSMFSFLNERNKCDFWHAIPHKRTCVYFSLVASIWTWILGIIVTSSIVNVILWAIAQYYTVSASAFFASIGVYFLVAIMMAAFMVLAMTITGTTISNVLILALLMLFVRVMGAIFTTCVSELAPMLDMNYSVLRILRFNFCLPVALLQFEPETFADGFLLLYTAAVVIFVVAMGAWGYCVRKSETATKSAPSPLMQHVYRCAVTLPLVFLIAMTFITGSAEASLVVILAIVAVLVWVIFELMTTKKFRNVLKSLPVLVVPVIISVLLSCGAYMVRDTVFNVTPDADEIEGINIGSDDHYTKTYEMLKTESLAVSNDRLNEIVSESLEQTVRNIRDEGKGFVSNSRHIIIRLKSGKTLGRYISMDDKLYQELLEGFYTSEEYRKAHLSMPTSAQIDSISVDGFDLSNNQKKQLWASFLYEYSLLDDEQKRVIKDYYTSGYTVSSDRWNEKYGELGKYTRAGCVYVSGTVGMDVFHSTYPVFYEYMPKTAQLYMEGRNNAFPFGAVDELETMTELFQKSYEAVEGNYAGGLYFDALCGNAEIGSISFDYSTKEKWDDDYMFELFEVLNSLEDPMNYEYDKQKTIVYCMIQVDIKGEYLKDIALGEYGIVEYDDDIYYYYNETFPLALTEDEVARILAIYQKTYGQ